MNEVLLDDSGKVPTDEEAQNIVEKVISIFDKDPFFDAAVDLGIDPNDDDFQAEMTRPSYHLSCLPLHRHS